MVSCGRSLTVEVKLVKDLFHLIKSKLTGQPRPACSDGRFARRVMKGGARLRAVTAMHTASMSGEDHEREP